MTRLLVDTQAFLWYLFDDPRMTEQAGRWLDDKRLRKVISVASLWEIVIKVQIGKLSLGMDTREFMHDHVERRELEVLGISLDHLLQYDRLPLHHRDPFDRLLIAQAMSESIPILTADASFEAYPVEVRWGSAR